MKSILAGIVAAILSFFGVFHAAAHRAAVPPATQAAAAAITQKIATTTQATSTTVTSTAPTATTNTGTTTTTIVNKYITEPVIERIVATTTGGVSKSEFQSALATLQTEIGNITSGGTPASPVANSIAAGGTWNAIAGSNKINNLSGVTISNSTIDAASIPDLSGSYLSIASTSVARSDLGLGYALRSDIVTASSSIAMWGDSLTAGYEALSVPQQLATLSNYPVYDGGVGGDTSTQIKARMLAATDKYSLPTIIWAGTNDITGNTSADESTIDSNISSMVSALQSAGNSRYLILGILNNSTETLGTAKYNEVIQINNDLATTYGSRFIDIRSYLINSGLADAGITATSQDTTDINNGVVPSSLRVDVVHLTTTGNRLVAQKIYDNFSLLGVSTSSAASSVVTLEGLRSALNDFSNGLQINGERVLYAASSTNGSTLVGIAAGRSIISGSNNTAVGFQSLYDLTTGSANSAYGVNSLLSATSSSYNSAFGVGALRYNTSGKNNSAFGYNALEESTTGTYNAAFGSGALINNTTGSNNTAVGLNALESNTTGSSNIGIGPSSLYYNSAGSNNIAIGNGASFFNNSATSSVAIGYFAGIGTGSYHNQGGVYVGYEAGHGARTGSDYNTLVGYQAGYGVTTGANNIILGANVDAPSATGNQQLNIGNVLYGTGIYNSGSVSSAPTANGKIGIGTTTPSTALTVNGTITPSTDNSGTLGNSAYRWNAVYATNGTIQTSDERLKKNIQSLSASSSLSELLQLNPVSFNWKDVKAGTSTQLGFIAQQVEPILPNIVSVGNDANHTLGLHYTEFIPVVVSAVQTIYHDLVSLEQTVAGFAKSFTTQVLTAATGHFNNELCVGSTCVTPAQFKAMAAAASQSGAGGSGTGATDIADTSANSSTTAPIIKINGNNPAYVTTGATYNDLGATITGPKADLNLGIKTFLNGTLMSPLTVDTSAAATDTIDYVVTDQNGLTSTSTRAVIIQAADAPSIVPAGDTASSTDSIATSTPLSGPSQGTTATTTDDTTNTATTTAPTAQDHQTEQAAVATSTATSTSQ